MHEIVVVVDFYKTHQKQNYEHNLMHFHRLCLKLSYCRGTRSIAFNTLCFYRSISNCNTKPSNLLCFRYSIYLLLFENIFFVYVLYI